MSGPKPRDIFTKGDEFRGIIFAKFADKNQRDDAVSVLRRARCQQDGKDVWAKPDLPFEERTMLVFGAKRVMTDWGYNKAGLWADPENGSLSLGGERVMCATIEGKVLKIDYGTGWQEFLNADVAHPEFKTLLQNIQDKLAKKPSKGKGKTKGNITKGQHRSSHVSPATPDDDDGSHGEAVTPPLSQETLAELIIFTRNARIGTDAKLAELLGELNGKTWDVILFSESRAKEQVRTLDGGYKLYTALGENLAAGVGILLRARHVRPNSKLRRFSDRVAALDFKVHGCKLRAVAAYVPHAGYADELLEATYDQLRAALTQARRAQLRTIVGGDFNTSLGVERRGALLHEFAAGHELCIANAGVQSSHGLTHGRSKAPWECGVGLTTFLLGPALTLSWPLRPMIWIWGRITERFVLKSASPRDAHERHGPKHHDFVDGSHGWTPTAAPATSRRPWTNTYGTYP